MDEIELSQEMQRARKELEIAFRQFQEANTPETIDIACLRIQAARCHMDAVRAEALLFRRSG